MLSRHLLGNAEAILHRGFDEVVAVCQTAVDSCLSRREAEENEINEGGDERIQSHVAIVDY